MNLSDFRVEIDKIDDQLVNLFTQRMDIAVVDGPALRHGLVLPLTTAGVGAGIAAVICLPALMSTGGIPNSLRIGSHEDLVAPALQLLAPSAVDKFIIFPMFRKPHR